MFVYSFKAKCWQDTLERKENSLPSDEDLVFIMLSRKLKRKFLAHLLQNRASCLHRKHIWCVKALTLFTKTLGCWHMGAFMWQETEAIIKLTPTHEKVWFIIQMSWICERIIIHRLRLCNVYLTPCVVRGGHRLLHMRFA